MNRQEHRRNGACDSSLRNDNVDSALDQGQPLPSESNKRPLPPYRHPPPHQKAQEGSHPSSLNMTGVSNEPKSRNSYGASDIRNSRTFEKSDPNMNRLSHNLSSPLKSRPTRWGSSPLHGQDDKSTDYNSNRLSNVSPPSKVISVPTTPKGKF